MNTSVYPMTKRELLSYKRQLNHRKVLRRRIAIALLSVLLVFLFVLSFNSIALATEELPETSYKYFTYHIVEKGDTLWNLAEEFIDYNYYKNVQDYVSEVKEINHMTDDTIRVGQTVVIPYFSTIYQ